MSRRRRRASGKHKRRTGAARGAGAASRKQRRAGSPKPAAATAAGVAERPQVVSREASRPRTCISPAADEALALGATLPRVPEAHSSPAARVQSQVFATAGLCALGATLGLLTVLNEIGYHAVSPGRGRAWAIAALCGGIVLGLWIPRRILRRRLVEGASGENETIPADPNHAGSVRHEFAASLSGVLIIAFALACGLLCGGAVFMEEYRAFLVRRFAPPIWLTYVLLPGPVYAGLVLTGVIGTTLLIALHGWYRLVAQPGANLTRLWTSILGGALAAGLLAHRIASPSVLALLSPLTVFLASATAVLRRSNATATPAPRPVPLPLSRAEALSLLTAGLAAATVGVVFFQRIRRGWDAPQAVALDVAVLTGAACCGLFVARVFPRTGRGADVGPVVLLVGAVALMLPFERVFAASADTAAVRLAVVATCAAACVVLVGRRLGRSSRSVQYALSWVGRFAAGGFGLALLMAPVGAGRWAAVAPARTAAADGPLAESARRLLLRERFRTARVRPLPPSANAATVWNMDLRGPPLDVVILESVTDAGGGSSSDAHLGRRLLRRATARLARGGRLLVELPTPPYVAAALDRFRSAVGGAGWSGYRLQVNNGPEGYEALVFGGDIPALIKRRSPHSGLEVSLERLRAVSGANR